MITLFILSLVGTALILLSMPFVAFALMVETCESRGAVAPSVTKLFTGANPPPSSRRPHLAHAA